MANGSDRNVDDAKSEKYVKRAQFAPGCCLFTPAGVKSSKRHTLLQKIALLFASTASNTCKWRSNGLMLFSLDSFIFLAGKISGLEGEILKPERTEHSEVNSKFQNPKAREDRL